MKTIKADTSKDLKTAGGIAAGAVVGSVLGPLGSAVGALVGGIAGGAIKTPKSSSSKLAANRQLPKKKKPRTAQKKLGTTAGKVVIQRKKPSKVRKKK